MSLNIGYHNSIPSVRFSFTMIVIYDSKSKWRKSESFHIFYGCPYLVVCFNWLLNHVIYFKLRKNFCCFKLCRFTKWKLFTFKMVVFFQQKPFWVKISVIFWICSAHVIYPKLRRIILLFKVTKLQNSTVRCLLGVNESIKINRRKKGYQLEINHVIQQSTEAY